MIGIVAGDFECENLAALGRQAFDSLFENLHLVLAQLLNLGIGAIDHIKHFQAIVEHKHLVARIAESVEQIVFQHPENEMRNVARGIDFGAVSPQLQEQILHSILSKLFATKIFESKSVSLPRILLVNTCKCKMITFYKPGQ